MSVDPSVMRARMQQPEIARALSASHARTLLSVCELAERHEHHVANIADTVTFMGLGQLSPVLADARNGDADWYYVEQVLDVTGATANQWREIRDDEIAEAAEERDWPARVDEYTSHRADGTTRQMAVCNWQMALMLALSGPWGTELMQAAEPAFRRAMVETGLGDQFQTVRVDGNGVAHETGETLTDAILADGPLPSAEVAREQVRRGPLGSLESGEIQ